MHFILVSIVQKVLDVPSIEWVSIPTQGGELSILPGHEPLITALTPGVLVVHTNGKSTSYVIGWGVAEITWEHVTITADMVEDGTHLDIDVVHAKKEEARRLLEEYREKGESMDMDVYVELEQQFLKESAREQLATR